MTTEEQDAICERITGKLQLEIANFKAETKEQFEKGIKDVSKGINRTVYRIILGSVAVVTSVFGLSFAYTTRVDSRVSEHHKQTVEITKDVNNMFNDMRTVSGTLFKENPESIILGGMYERYNRNRGNIEE